MPGFVIGSILAIAVLVLHPAGRELVHLERVERIDSRLAGLYVIGALPILLYGGFELVKQLGPVDDHVLFVHFGAMTVASLFIVIMGGLAVVRQQDWRFAAWSTSIVAVFVGAVSIAYPAVESSLGLLGGGLLITWAIIFVAAVELSRAGTNREDNTIEEALSKPA